MAHLLKALVQTLWQTEKNDLTLTNDGGEDANAQNGDHKGKPSVQIVRWGHQREQQLPEQRHVVQCLLLAAQGAV